MSKPLTLQIYLPTGEPQGTRIANLTTRTVTVFDVPRREIEAFFQRKEADQVAVYYLFGTGDEDEIPSCYIGRTSAARQRFREHLQKEDKRFWTRALIAVSSTNSKTDTHAGYLEWKSIQAAQQAGRYQLVNANAGSRPHTTEPLQAECEEIFETISILISTLGFLLFQPLATQAPKSQDIVVFCKGRGADAKAIYSTDGLTVFADSRCALEPTCNDPTTAGRIRKKRDELLKTGHLQTSGEGVIFQKDTLFPSPSQASAVILYRSSNGWNDWKDQAGKTLNQIIRGDDHVEDPA
ncbi:GIY-YIG nuclease family protein [Acidithiobacillus sp. IBUN Pt1247-S3]|uniref:GIY-YIG nuclease family protein n=1 Tax=Acidithiobacillus sp. IBUN Pt1247-S3 TaxID=3166642 RepID=UPI0034E4E50A